MMTAWYMLCLLLIGCPQVFSIILRGPVTGTVDLQLPERVAERRDSINFSGFRIESGPDSYKPQAAMISKGIVHPLCNLLIAMRRVGIPGLNSYGLNRTALIFSLFDTWHQKIFKHRTSNASEMRSRSTSISDIRISLMLVDVIET